MLIAAAPNGYVLKTKRRGERKGQIAQKTSGRTNVLLPSVFLLLTSNRQKFSTGRIIEAGLRNNPME